MNVSHVKLNIGWKIELFFFCLLKDLTQFAVSWLEYASKIY